LIEGKKKSGASASGITFRRTRKKLKADALVVSDTSMLGKGVPSITYGLRGLNYYQIELTGPERRSALRRIWWCRPQSAHHLDGAVRETHDKNYRVAVPAFYDRVAMVSKAERKALNALPWKKKDFEKAVGAPGYFGEKGLPPSNGSGLGRHSN